MKINDDRMTLCLKYECYSCLAYIIDSYFDLYLKKKQLRNFKKLVSSIKKDIRGIIDQEVIKLKGIGLKLYQNLLGRLYFNDDYGDEDNDYSNDDDNDDYDDYDDEIEEESGK